jgi:hypothetical protein
MFIFVNFIEIYSTFYAFIANSARLSGKDNEL